MDPRDYEPAHQFLRPKLLKLIDCRQSEPRAAQHVLRLLLDRMSEALLHLDWRVTLDTHPKPAPGKGGQHNPATVGTARGTGSNDNHLQLRIGHHTSVVRDTPFSITA